MVDRAGVLDAPPERVWPWLVQMGNARGGWYLPGWLEAWLPAGWRGARGLLPAFGTVGVGDLTIALLVPGLNERVREPPREGIR